LRQDLSTPAMSTVKEKKQGGLGASVPSSGRAGAAGQKEEKVEAKLFLGGINEGGVGSGKLTK